ncbi:reverse transcriptase domain-containing protein [Tanacetum coccineum]
MTLELADISITHPIGFAEDDFIKLVKFHFPADFVVVDYDADPWVPLILGRPFLRTARALIDVYEKKITLRFNMEAITFKVGQTSRYSYNNSESVNQIDVIDISWRPLFFLLEEVMNEDPSLNLPPMKNDDLKQVDVTMTKPSIEEPPELELKDLPSHLEYAFLEGTDKLPVIISKELKEEEKAALLKVLKSHKWAIAWKISDIKGIDPSFCTHKILMEDDFKPAVQHQRRVNPKIHEVIKKEVIKLLDAGLIYPISDSPWVSPVHCVPKKGGMTVVENEDNELIPTRLVTGWRVCIDYRKLNDATRKDHFPLPFMDQMLERSGLLPSNTVANPRGDVKAITTRSGVSYDGPTIPPTPSPLPKEVERETEATKDKLDECLALADLGASINLMPLSVWKQLSLPELTSTRMTLELANRSTVIPEGVTEDVFVKVGKFYFLADFFVVDYDVDPRVPLILGSPFLMTAKALIDVHVNVIDVACEEYAQEVLGFSNCSTSSNPTPSDPIIASSSPSFAYFEGGDLILEEIETFLRTLEELSNLDDDYYDTEGDILYLEKLLNEDPSPNLPPMKNNDLKQVDVPMTKPSIEEPPELELKDLPSHLEYAFLEGTDKLPVIISKELKEEEKAALLKVSPVHCVPKKGGMTVVENEDNELIPTRLVTGWRVCIDYHKLNDATRKDHFLFPFMDQMLECLARNEYYCFLDGFSGYFQIPIDPQDQEKTTFTCPYGTFAYPVCLSAYVMLRARSKDKILKRCEDTNLVLNWEKCHFMVKEGIVLGHKISKSGIEVDRAKVDVIAKLPHLSSIKGVQSFLGHARFYRRCPADDPSS